MAGSVLLRLRIAKLVPSRGTEPKLCPRRFGILEPGKRKPHIKRGFRGWLWRDPVSPSRAVHMQGGFCAGGPSAQKVREGPGAKSNAADGPRSRRVSQPVSRVLSRIIIHLDRKSPSGLEQPTRKRRGQRHGFPIWSCSGWGLHCRPRYRGRGALLPHHFTLTGLPRRYIFCCTSRGLAPPRRYLAPCPAEPGLSSSSRGNQRLSG